MKYLSVCSGIEAATVAWHPLGWEPVAFSEVDAFPSAVLRHHYPAVPNYGDMTKFQEWPDADVDVLVGGTPCQSFSVAGLRAGLADPRGNLMLVYLALARRYRPRWLVWENVPGVLSSNGGRDFGTFLGGLAECGYGFAYRVLDAQYFGLAQRRKRVFVVGHLGNWQRAAAVLLERQSLSGHPAPRREAGQVAPTVPSRRSAGGGLGTDFDCDGGVIASTGPISHCLNAGGMGRIDYETETLIAHAFDARQSDVIQYGDQSGPLDTDDHTIAIAIQGAATRENPTSGPDGIGVRTDDCAYTLEARSEVQAVAIGSFQQNSMDGRGTLGWNGDGDAPLRPVKPQRDHQFVVTKESPMSAVAMKQTSYVRQHMAVRRLTPRECERLMGFCDDYTLIPYRGKLAADGPRYKSLGNSMAVPVVRWIGQRIAAVEAL